MASTLVDDRAFERLYRRHVRDVYRFALSLLRNPAEAEDVTQTTFLNAYRALRAGEQPRRPQSWLLTIAHNAARSRVRLAMRRPREVSLDDAAELMGPEPVRTNVRELVRALARLPFNQRTAITMRELEGRSYDEIAETLGVTVPAVEALLSRARRSLRSHAAAIRGAAVFVLPRPLRRLLEEGGPAAGAKAAVVVAAAVVAGGVGYTVEAGAPARPHVVPPRVEPVRHSARPHAQAQPRREAKPKAKADVVRGRAAAPTAGPGPQAVPAATIAAVLPAAPPASAPPQQAPAVPPVRQAVDRAVDRAVATVPELLPELPTVTLPPLPPVPPVPTVPAPPNLP